MRYLCTRALVHIWANLSYLLIQPGCCSTTVRVIARWCDTGAGGLHPQRQSAPAPQANWHQESSQSLRWQERRTALRPHLAHVRKCFTLRWKNRSANSSLIHLQVRSNGLKDAVSWVKVEIISLNWLILNHQIWPNKSIKVASFFLSFIAKKNVSKSTKCSKPLGLWIEVSSPPTGAS